MKMISTFFEKSKKQGDIWFFYFFIFSLPFTIRKVILFYPINKENVFNEYTGVYLYLSDLILVFLLIFWLIFILYNKSITLSIFSSVFSKKLWISCVKSLKKCSIPVRMFYTSQNVPRGTSNRTSVGHPTRQAWNIYKDKLIFIPLLLVVWSFISIFWSENHLISFFRSIKILEFFLLYLFIKKRLFNNKLFVPDRNNSQSELGGWNIWKNICRIFIFLGLFQAIIGTWQFFIQKSIGLFWLKESLISPEILGVAKVIIGGEKYIRSYGLFPHPNILGGFLLFSIIVTYAYKEMFHARLDSRKRLVDARRVEHFKAKTYYIFSLLFEKIYNIVPRGTFINIFLGIQIIALLLTFSKSAIIGLIVAVIYIFIHMANVPRPPRLAETSRRREAGRTLKKKKLFHLEQFRQLKYLFILSFLLFGILLFYFKVDFYALFIQSLEERFIYLVTSIQAISQNMLWGLGNGQFVLEVAKYSFQNLESWQFQPVHNVFLLIFSELGMIGLFLFIWFLLELFHVEQSENKNKCSTWNIYLKSILLVFTFIMIFDHYLWDIQQGSLMLWLVMGLIVARE